MIALLIFSPGILTSLAFSSTVLSLGFPSGSPPPSLAATVISLAILEKIFPLFASTTAFLCFICAHLECPDMKVLQIHYPFIFSQLYDQITKLFTFLLIANNFI